MIDSNNLDVIRTNIRTLNENVLESNGDIATIIEDISDLEDDVESIENTIGTTPLPEGETITLALTELKERSPFSNSVLGGTFTRSGQTLMLRFYTTPSQVDDDSILIQFRGGNNDIRYVIKEGGVTTYDKKATLA